MNAADPAVEPDRQKKGKEDTLTELQMGEARSKAGEPMHRRLLNARLMTLLRVMRESGLPEYDRRVGLNELNRQLITMIGGRGGLTSNDLVAYSGHEKAQISRAVKSLEEGSFIERASLRAKLTLMPEGERLFDEIMAISRARDVQLASGLTAAERKQFIAMTRALIVRAAEIYGEERRLTAEAAAFGSGAPPPPVPSYGQLPDKHGIGKIIGPQLAALVSYLRRAAMLAYQREHGLSNFQWMILSQIGEYEPLPLARLIEIMGRDKSQVGRTVAYFQEVGLIERHRVARKRDIMVTTTPHGSAVYNAMCSIAVTRDEKLTAGYSADERAWYFAIVERLEANARRMATTASEPAKAKV